MRFSRVCALQVSCECAESAKRAFGRAHSLSAITPFPSCSAWVSHPTLRENPVYVLLSHPNFPLPPRLDSLFRVRAAYAWYVEEAAPFFVDHFNLTSGVVVEDVTLPTVRVIDDNVVQPTVQATQAAVNSTAQFVSDSAAATSGAIAGTADAAVHNDAVHSVEEGLHTMGDEAARQAAMLRDATDKALITPTKEALMENVVPQMANHGRKIAEYTDHVEHFVNDKIVTPLRDSEALRSTGDAVKRTYAGAHYHFHHSFLPTVMDSVFLRLV